MAVTGLSEEVCKPIQHKHLKVYATWMVKNLSDEQILRDTTQPATLGMLSVGPLKKKFQLDDEVKE